MKFVDKFIVRNARKIHISNMEKTQLHIILALIMQNY